MVVLLDFFVARGHVGPVGGDVGVDGGGFLVFGNGGGVLSVFEEFVSFGFEGFGFGMTWHGEFGWVAVIGEDGRWVVG